MGNDNTEAYCPEITGTITLTEESRKNLLEMLKKMDEDFINSILDGRSGFTLACSDGRSVELEPKIKARWEPIEEGYRHRCSSCKEPALDYQESRMNGENWTEEYLTRRCPNCGATMEE